MSRAEVINNPTDPLILQTKLEEMQVYTHKAIMQFPKREKFLLCAEIKESLAEAMHLVIRMKKRYFKKTTLQDIDVEIDYMRTLVREADALGFISHGRLKEWIGHIDEAGKILGGLFKYYKEKGAEKEK